ncbi:MAG: ABC transporter permease subunit [Bacteroidetes bacterium]|jgi:ABC-2 type transport system permease protein|nr:ABC transporter permease subunit [Bacteroidota bacterium]MBT3749753.1 ABC transporter permease subunit [Bacteroidota bacterium]MBT4400710.1 ABC transporter permease subunit [Bacteroidota bacterium]MBT4408226.1 ABC transporter permease subunit [Bacteroidota bacterium]MBT5425406.1 ABC transporter permease subunit [Bacteroidota bacterium]
MRKLISIELYKIFTKPRTYIGFGAIFIIIIAIQIGIGVEGDEMMDFIIQNIKDRFIFEGNIINVYLISYVILNTLWFHVPLLITLVTGDLLAGEANSGTYRILLSRPVSRIQLVLAKFIAGWIYTLLIIILMILLSIGVGSIFFGMGDLIAVTDKVNIFAADDLLWRFGLAYAYGLLAMTTVGALSFFLSAFADNSIGPIIGTVAIIIGVTIISTVGASLMGPVNKYVFTTYLPSWQYFFHSDLNPGLIWHAVLIQFIYILLFLSATLIYFRKKDILS